MRTTLTVLLGVAVAAVAVGMALFGVWLTVQIAKVMGWL